MVSEIPFSERSRAMALFQRGHRLHCVYLALLARDKGKVLADDPNKPTVAMFAHPFFTVIAGDCRSPVAGEMLKKAQKNKIILPLDSGWNASIKSMYGGRAIPLPRTKFAEEAPDLANARALAGNVADGYSVEAISQDNVVRLLETFKDTKEISGLFWTAETFPKESFGFVALDRERNMVSVAIMGTPLHDKAFEIHTETHPGHRKKGLATAVNAALIVDAARRGLVPLWDAANENSVGLAKKLGFRETERYEIFVLLGWGLYAFKKSGVPALIKWMVGRKRKSGK